MDSESSKNVATPQSEKKFKQARLPFAIIRSDPKESPQPLKKLKPNEPSDNAEIKENIELHSDIVQENPETNVNNAKKNDVDIEIITIDNEDSVDRNTLSIADNENSRVVNSEVKIDGKSHSKDEEMKESIKDDAVNDSNNHVIVNVDESNKRKADDDSDSKAKRLKLDVKEKLMLFARKSNVKSKDSDSVEISNDKKLPDNVNNIEIKQNVESCSDKIEEKSNTVSSENTLNHRNYENSAEDLTIIDAKEASPNESVKASETTNNKNDLKKSEDVSKNESNDNQDKNSSLEMNNLKNDEKKSEDIRKNDSNETQNKNNLPEASNNNDDKKSEDMIKNESNENEGNSSSSESDKKNDDKKSDANKSESSENQEKNSLNRCTTPKSKTHPDGSAKKKSMKKLTPKQIQKDAEAAKRREEKQRKEEEKERKKQELEEEKKRKKEEKERLKEEKEKKRQAEIEQKNEERKKKEEERRRKEEEKLEEKRKKEEEKRKKEEELQKKKEEIQKKKEEENQLKKKFTKEAEAFSNYFKKVDSKSEANSQDDDRPLEKITFMPFTVKSDMRLAPVNRNPMDLERRSRFEEMFGLQNQEETYLIELKSNKIEPKKSGNTWPLEEKYEDVVIMEEELDLNDAPVETKKPKAKNIPAKLLQFHENRRPPYWGSWRKKSKNIRPRNPFGKDKVFDYEIDSDDEWEEEEPGESLHGSDDEKEPEDDYEVDNDFFVPHGYLSDDENPEDEVLSPETQKAKLKLLGEQFDMERNEKTKQLRPITIGCVWFKHETDEPEGVHPSIVKLLDKRKAVFWVESKSIIIGKEENSDASDFPPSENGKPCTPSSSKKAFPESATPELIRFLHGNANSRKTVIKKFLFYLKEELNQTTENENSFLPTKTCVSKKIKELGTWQEFPEEGSLFGKTCWYVKKEIRERYDLFDLPIPNKYEETSLPVENKEIETAKKNSPSLITKFTKVLSEDERKSQLKAKPERKSIGSISSGQNSEIKSARKLLHFWSKAPANQSGILATKEVDQEAITLDDDAEPVKMEDVDLTESPQKKEVRTAGASAPQNLKNELKNEEKFFPTTDSSDHEAKEDETFKNETVLSTEESKNQNETNLDARKTEDGVQKAEDADARQKTAENQKTTLETVSKLKKAEDRISNQKPAERANETAEEMKNPLPEPENKSVDEPEIEIVNEIETKRIPKPENTSAPPINGRNEKPAVKKRVAILFSAPRGCDIVKPTEQKNS